MSDKVRQQERLRLLVRCDAPRKRERARALVESEGTAGNIVVSTQVLQEFYVSVTRKLGKPLAEAAVREIAAFEVVEPDVALVLHSIAIARSERLSLWDALIVEAARARACERLLSEDLQDGRRFDSLCVGNPFR